jgi:hypothetical protein
MAVMEWILGKGLQDEPDRRSAARTVSIYLWLHRRHPSER